MSRWPLALTVISAEALAVRWTGEALPGLEGLLALIALAAEAAVLALAPPRWAWAALGARLGALAFGPIGASAAVLAARAPAQLPRPAAALALWAIAFGLHAGSWGEWPASPLGLAGLGLGLLVTATRPSLAAGATVGLAWWLITPGPRPDPAWPDRPAGQGPGLLWVALPPAPDEARAGPWAPALARVLRARGWDTAAVLSGAQAAGAVSSFDAVEPGPLPGRLPRRHPAGPARPLVVDALLPARAALTPAELGRRAALILLKRRDRPTFVWLAAEERRDLRPPALAPLLRLADQQGLRLVVTGGAEAWPGERLRGPDGAAWLGQLQALAPPLPAAGGPDVVSPAL